MYDFIVSMSREQQMEEERARVRHFLRQTGWQEYVPTPGPLARWVTRLRDRVLHGVPARPAVRAAGPMGCSV